MDEITETSTPGELALIVGNDLFGEDSDLVVQDRSPVTTIDNDSGKIVQGKEDTSLQTQQNKPSQNTASQSQPQLKALPKSWKKDMEPHWAKLDPAVHDYVYNREADVMRGLQMYQEGHNLWTETVKPFSEVLKQHPSVNPVSLIQQLLHNHLSITFGTPEQKKTLAQNLLKAYGIDLSGTETSQTEVTPEIRAIQTEIQALRRENQTLRNGFQTFQASQQEISLASQTKLVADFFSDPKNEFAEELGDNILHLIKTGAAADLQSAYDLACMMNPAVRAKVLAKQQATSTPGTQNPAKSDPKNISDSGDGNLRTRRKTSWEDDVDDIVKSHYSKH
jgi:hypothetical protein